MRSRKTIRRILAFIMACIMIWSVLAYAREAYVWPPYLDIVEATFSEACNSAIDGQNYIASGLAFEWTCTDKKTSSQGFEKYWMNDKNSKTGTMKLKGSGEEVDIDFSKFDHRFLSCIADHTDVAAGLKSSFGSQLALTSVYFPTNNADDYPPMIKGACRDIDQMKFNLLLISLLHNQIGTISDTDIRDSMSYTGYAAIMYCAVRAIDRSRAYSGKSADEDWNNLIQYGFSEEIEAGYNPDLTGSSAIWESFSNEGKAYFKKCWEDAKFLSYFNYTANSVTIPMTEAVIKSDGLYHRIFDYSMADSVTKGYMQALKLKADVDKIIFLNDGSKLDFSSKSDEYLKDNSEPMQQIVLELDPSVFDQTEVEIAPAGLCGFKYIVVGYVNNQVTDKYQAAGQTRFAAYQTELTITTTTIPDEPPEPNPDVPHGEFHIDIHRFEHRENWESNYNVNLVKYDSETGQPLEGAEFDILEAFDSSQLASSPLEDSSNWANSDGSQFVKWDGWDYGPGNEDGEVSDPCDMDGDITNEDGYLTNKPTGDIAHSDKKYYVYNKGYCGGHSEPVITYYEDDGSNPEAIKELNKKLEEAAKLAWQTEVDKCEALAAEGGFFHSLEADTAKKELKDDRDRYYKDFISLKYDYSAAEILAKPGYIKHGIHPDDIPVETKTVTSSELKDLIGNKNDILPHSDEEQTPIDENTELTDSLEASILSLRQPATPSNASEGNLTEVLNIVPAVPGVLFSENDEYEGDIEENILVADMEITSDNDSEFIPKASASEAEEKLDVASPSNAKGAEKEENFLKSLFQTVQTFITWIGNGVRNFAISIFNEEEETPAKNLRDTISFEKSEADCIGELQADIVDHTFIFFDHRTEGEIHFNKRDLNLDQSSSEVFDSYGVSNGDGRLEGAVYGLFAASNIIHPDGKTGTVYKKGNLVAIATTDRNGDASFIAFTEKPGVTYNYDKGCVENAADGWADETPKNLHLGQKEGDSFCKDNEIYVGYDSNNCAQDLIDSDTVDDTVYKKHSSNQSGLEGIKGTATTYPIANNELNNGNCWIGRPLIAQPDGSSYTIRELSRSEGYELSVNGKENLFTNGKDSYLKAEDGPSVSITVPTYDGAEGALYATLNVKDGGAELHLEGKDISKGAVFAASEVKNITETSKVPYRTEIIKPITGAKDSYVYLDGKRVEAGLGDTITVGGLVYTVNNILSEAPARIGVMPRNYISYGTPLDTTLHTSNFEDFMNEYNEHLSSIGYKETTDTSPWVKIELTGSTDTEWLINLTQYLVKHHLIYFNEMRIREIINENGKNYAMLSFDYYFNGSGSAFDNAVYNPIDKELYVRMRTEKGYDVFVAYHEDDPAIENLVKNGNDFVTSASIAAQQVICDTTYPEALPDNFILADMPERTYWTYDGIQQKFNDDGSLATKNEWIIEYRDETLTHEEEVLTPLVSNYLDNVYAITVPEEIFTSSENIKIKIYSDGSGGFNPMDGGRLVYKPTNDNLDSYTHTISLSYQGQETILEDGGTTLEPVSIKERPIRQKIIVKKDIVTWPETKLVWCCGNCGKENVQDSSTCAHCQKERSTEAVKCIEYPHDTYSSVHEDNISADRNAGSFEMIKDWLYHLLNRNMENKTAKSIPNFRFKAYLKSNLERLYRDNDGNIIWMDRNGNIMVPQYQDTTGDGNYDTVIWNYTDPFEGRTIDYPEKNMISDSQVLESSNVPSIFTKVQHELASKTVSAVANNVWDVYSDPQTGVKDNAGELGGYSTSLREDIQDGLSGKAIHTNSALYSFDGKNINTVQSDRINDEQNQGYTRLLETTGYYSTDNGNQKTESAYNYEKFFDAICAANLDVWDDDMHSTFTGASMSNYPGQHWLMTYYEKYQKDDADPEYTMEHTDSEDYDNTAGGDSDTSFKPLRWIRNGSFGSHDDYEKYPAQYNGENTDTTRSVSNYATANADASDAVRQFATKWYLEAEVAKLVKNNGSDEDIALGGGDLPYDESVYDEALFQAIAKSYNYLKPFYSNDLDTIYSVEWDSEADGGADRDYTTLSIDRNGDREYYNVSSCLPYGVYVIVEQQPHRIDSEINDMENKNYSIAKPNEVLVPSVYDATTSNAETNNFKAHYTYKPDMELKDQAKGDQYLIRFGEEWANNTTQDQREYVIRAHNQNGDYEIYKYGLDIDKLSSEITYPGGSYDYDGFRISQDVFDPLKDYYSMTHHGKTGTSEAGTEQGGNTESRYQTVDRNQGSAANGNEYDSINLADRYYYGAISEDCGISNQTDTMTGGLTAYDGIYAQMLVPWSVTEPADKNNYSADEFNGYADLWFHDSFYSAKLRINKVDSETGEYILHDNAIFGLYAGSRYTTFEEIEKDARLIADPDERDRFLKQWKPGDAKFYLQDTEVEGSREFLEAMGAVNIINIARTQEEDIATYGPDTICSGTVSKGTPICVENERIMLTDDSGVKSGQLTVYTTLNDTWVAGGENSTNIISADQNTGYFITPQPLGAGVYVLAEIKSPDGYIRSRPVAYEVYSDKTQYYADGDMYAKVSAVRYTN